MFIVHHQHHDIDKNKICTIIIEQKYFDCKIKFASDIHIHSRVLMFLIA